MAKSELIVERPMPREGGLRLAAELRAPTACPLRLWYEVPEEWEPAVTDVADPFVIGLTFAMMRSGGPVRVRGRASPTLLRNLEEFTAIWQAWRPDRYRRIDVCADEEDEGLPSASGEAAMGFSGGLDSCYTAWRHHKGLAGRSTANLRAGVFIRGFDIPLSSQEAYENARQRNERILGSVGMALIPMATNLRELAPVDWEDAHGTMLASCLALLQRRFGLGLMASSWAYSKLVSRWGSTPWTDWLFSSEAFPVRHDGAESSRLQKSKTIAEWPEALRYMRVCWQGPDKDVNCCACEKCIRTLLTFRILGVRRPGCFPHDVTDGQIRALRLVQPGPYEGFGHILERAREAGLGGESWVRACEYAMARSRPKRLRSVRHPMQAMRRPGPLGRVYRHLTGAWHRFFHSETP